MSKVFRRIRQRLLEENKVTRYILYAIGEIILVVIGILIALQIDNNSEYKKERKIEVHLLENLANEVGLDIKQIESNTHQSTLRLQRLDSLLLDLHDPNKINSASFLNKSYDFVIDNYFTSNSGIFDEAVSSGKMSFIENETLRQNIFDYYRVARNSYTDGTTRQITDEIITPLMIESLFLNTDGLSMIAADVKNNSNLNDFDPKALTQNKDFWRMVLLKFGGNKEQMIKWQLLKKEAEQLKQEIDEELKRLNHD